MKRFVFVSIFGFLLSPFVGSSQYFPFPDTMGIWHYSGYQVLIQLSCVRQQQGSAFYGDTITINSNLYREVHVNHYDYPDWCTPPNLIYTHSLYLMREDTTARKVYLFVNGQDSLLYDFNLQQGDTVNTGLWNLGQGPQPPIIVDTIISTLIGTSLRKEWVLNDGFFNMSFYPGSIIEGIGSTTGFIPWIGIFENRDRQLDCFSADGDGLYPIYNPGGECMILSVNHEQETEEFSIAPNPNNGNFNINFKSNEEKQIQIIDVMGRVVVNLEGTETTFNLTNLSSGIYSIVVSSPVGLSSQKFVIK